MNNNNSKNSTTNNTRLDDTESMEDSWSMMEEEILVPAALQTEIRCLHSAVGAAIATEPPFRIHVCFTLTAGQLQEEKRAAVDIVVALDVSGSMNGTKLQLCKRTLQQLLRLLSSEDRFGLVTYASTAKLSCPLRKMTAQNKATALSIIQSLTTRDTTNISSAIGLAFQELRTLEGPNTIQTVFLLTDGQANGGITIVSELEEFTKSCIRGPASTIPHDAPSGTVAVVPERTQQPLSMHCFGYGSDHDELLLSTISAAASGSYYNIDEDSAVDGAFGDALGGIMSMVAQSATATFRLHPDAVAQGVRIVKIHHNEVIERENGSFSVNVGDFYAEETRDVLLELQLEPTVVDKGVEGVPHVIASVAYSNVSQKIPVQGPEQIVSIQRTEGTECSEQDEYVATQLLRILTTEALDRAQSKADRGDFQAAQSEIIGAQNSILHSPMPIQSGFLMCQLQSDLTEVSEGLTSAHMYNEIGSKRLRTRIRAHRAQRCAETSVANQSMNAYVTSSKMSFLNLMKPRQMNPPQMKPPQTDTM